MTLFTYQATDEDGKPVRGSIEAPTTDAAKRALEDLHYEIQDIAEASRSRPSSQAPTASSAPVTFAFEGHDGQSTMRRGTVQAQTKRQAFEKLSRDQSLTLTMLSPMGVTPPHRDRDLEQWQGPSGPPPLPIGKPAVGAPVNIRSLPLAPPPPLTIQRSLPAFTAPSAPPPPPVSVKIPSSPVAKPPLSKPAAPPLKPIGFTTIPDRPAPPLAAAPKLTVFPPPAATKSSGAYHPISATLRLYVGWLLAWYALFVSVGYYTHERQLPWDIPFVESFYLSPLIFSFVVAIFLFLGLSTLNRVLKGGLIGGVVFTVIGAGAFYVVRMSL